uniref:Uncharacterized protein n=1 Tax=Rhizophora mucronata TaxID=61149 RepID=A0A2P2QB92_RHIMU
MSFLILLNNKWVLHMVSRNKNPVNI